jgi:hypothetical protein
MKAAVFLKLPDFSVLFFFFRRGAKNFLAAVVY